MSSVLKKVRNAVADRSCATLCLDIFDTILWRRVPRPSDTFPILGEELRRDGRCPSWVTDATFRHMRINAEIQSRRVGHGPEVSLFDIWRQMPLEIFDATLDELVAAEIDIERRFLVVDFDIAELIATATEHQVPIVLVSDTYFTEAQLRHLLDRPGLEVLKDARLFRSHEYGLDKASGLWHVVLDELELRPEQLWHVGDNWHADVHAPGALGIRCLHYERIDARLASVFVREKGATGPLRPHGPAAGPRRGRLRAHQPARQGRAPGAGGPRSERVDGVAVRSRRPRPGADRVSRVGGRARRGSGYPRGVVPHA